MQLQVNCFEGLVLIGFSICPQHHAAPASFEGLYELHYAGEYALWQPAETNPSSGFDSRQQLTSAASEAVISSFWRTKQMRKHLSEWRLAPLMQTIMLPGCKSECTQLSARNHFS